VGSISGIGKTTLAKAVFKRIRGQFEAGSFLTDVKPTRQAVGYATKGLLLLLMMQRKKS